MSREKSLGQKIVLKFSLKDLETRENLDSYEMMIYMPQEQTLVFQNFQFRHCLLLSFLWKDLGSNTSRGRGTVPTLTSLTKSERNEAQQGALQKKKNK